MQVVKKRGRSEHIKNITEREKSRSKREKSVVRRSEHKVRKLVWSISEKAV